MTRLLHSHPIDFEYLIADELDLEPAQPATTWVGTSSTDNVTNINTPTFSGTADTGSTVSILDRSTVAGSRGRRQWFVLDDGRAYSTDGPLKPARSFCAGLLGRGRV